MTKLVIGQGVEADMTSFDIGGFDIIESDVLTLSHTEFVVDAEDGFTQTYTGTDFADPDHNDVPDSGTLTGWDNSFNGNQIFTLTKFSMAWEDYWNFVDTDDGTGFLSAVLAGKDKIVGNDQDDVLLGFDGNDIIKGGKGRDTLEGGDGTDKLIGGANADRLTGGAKGDKFVFQKISESPFDSPDLITDFRPIQGDLIDLHKIDADPGTEVDDAFFLGGDTFTNTVGELIQDVFKDGRVHLQGDIDGDGFADFDIGFLGKLSLTIDDIIF